MNKQTLVLITLGVMLPSLVLAARASYTFSNVVINDTTIEIEAVVKDTKKNDHSRCDYFSNDYVDWLGHYSEPVAAGSNAATVESFCIDNFNNKVVD